MAIYNKSKTQKNVVNITFESGRTACYELRENIPTLEKIFYIGRAILKENNRREIIKSRTIFKPVLK